MFNKKYTVSVLDCKWQVLKRNLKLVVIPRRDEYLFFDGSYYEVVNVIHMLNKNQDVFIVVSETQNQIKPIENQ